MINEIKICMGSSCFARGNNENLEIVENYVKENGLDSKIEIYGQRCSNDCQIGPNISINGKIYNNITKEQLIEELRKLN